MNIQVVYSPKTQDERERRAKRAEEFLGRTFLNMPGDAPAHKVLFITSNGMKVRREHVEMVYNDMLLMDAISDNGIDGPLYETTVDGDQREILEYAKKVYRGMTWDNLGGVM